MAERRVMEIAIVGGGIIGLGLALNLHRHGLSCRVYEAVPDVKELGVGITLLPHAMRELALLGLQERIEPLGIENQESCFFNRFGQLIYREPRGRYAGYSIPEIGIHRGRLHRVLYDAASSVSAPSASSPTAAAPASNRTRPALACAFGESTGEPCPQVHADILIGCDGVNSTVRAQFYPGRKARLYRHQHLARGNAPRPILDRTHLYAGRLDPSPAKS